MVPDKLRRAGPIFASAVLYSLAFPPLNLGLLVLVALAPWFVSLIPTETHQPRAFRSGFLFGFLITLYQLLWVVPLVKQWTGSPSLGFAPYLICALLGGVFFGGLGWLIAEAIRRKMWWAVPLLFAGHEVARSYVPIFAFPFFLVSTPLWPFPYLIQTAYLGTQYLTSAWVVLINVLVVFFLIKAPFFPLRKYAIVAILGCVASMLRYVQPIPGEQRTFAAIQPGVNMAFGDEQTRRDQLFDNVAQLYVGLDRFRIDFVLFPEGMAAGSNGSEPILPFEIQPKYPTIVGGQRVAGPRRYQSAFGFDGTWQHADKARLVAFGEYVPGRDWIPFLEKFKLPGGDMSAAEETRALTVGGIKVGPMICFEGLFWDIAQRQVDNGAQLLAVMAVDDWYMGTGTPDQLRAASIWRAVETDLPVLRAAATGYSMAIDQRGRVISEVPIGGPQAVVANLRIPEKPTAMPSRRFVPWFFAIFFFGYAGWCAFSRFKPASAKP
ncbi:MAG: apolipoprotein N-acyltransferase [Methanoregulaceae archaeon]|nr:apolipoprotein N-acyltransferase [Methanoregulaceae archaeon]